MYSTSTYVTSTTQVHTVLLESGGRRGAQSDCLRHTEQLASHDCYPSPPCPPPLLLMTKASALAEKIFKLSNGISLTYFLYIFSVVGCRARITRCISSFNYHQQFKPSAKDTKSNMCISYLLQNHNERNTQSVGSQPLYDSLLEQPLLDEVAGLVVGA